MAFVVDPWALIKEIEEMKKLGVAISRDNLRIAENATLILSCHRELDSLNNQALAQRSVALVLPMKIKLRAVPCV